jgi:HEAT repeat protein
LKGSKNDFYNNEPAPIIKGGPKRLSRKVDLERFPAIRRRQELATELMKNTCATEPGPISKFMEKDLPVLMQIAQETGANVNPLLRKNAIRSLRQFKLIEVIELLLRISSSSSEHESIRGQALITLARISPLVTSNVIQSFLMDQPESIRQYAVTALEEIGDEKSLLILRNLIKKEHSRAIKSQAEASIRSVESRLGMQVSKLKVRKQIRRAQAPAVDHLK